ncbi:16578_t:CDS:2 [Acaulospora colombiana]|uniref:16578_t:CDS:1 n=1 Tax=Acaulospora colombiana TaxID=27376 RepID=A0ACA9KJR4_9GLOM|nr:16578_t:CDS:2 [Acaulospora colombiana]
MVWKGLALYTNSESPIVVVLSGSMEPAFYRGDLLFLGMPEEPIQIGDICVFKITDREVPIVHRKNHMGKTFTRVSVNPRIKRNELSKLANNVTLIEKRKTRDRSLEYFIFDNYTRAESRNQDFFSQINS